MKALVATPSVMIDGVVINRVSRDTINMSKNRPVAHDPAEWFAASRAARLSQLSLAMVNYLCRAGVVEPSCSCPRGHGTPRHYSFGDVVALRLVAKLSKNGVRPLRLKKAMEGLRRFHPEITLSSLPASHIVTNGSELYLRQGDETVERAFDGQFAFAFVVELAQLQREVAQRLGSKRPTDKSARKAA